MASQRKIIKQVLETFPPRPKMPYSSFDDFIYKTQRAWHRKPYYCFVCDGRGRVVHPDAFNDPVEGYKMAEHVDCLECKGTGQVGKEVWREEYRKHMDAFRKDLAGWRKDTEYRRRGLEKLTDEEIRALDLD